MRDDAARALPSGIRLWRFFPRGRSSLRRKNARAKTAHETMQRSKKTNLESAKNTRDINAKTKAQSQKTESRRKKAAMKTKHNLKAKQRSSRGEM
mmetsp:Transcript_20488/g.72923  ORF Transcript_20488/g.72923 Transcript_20488/m.72923 type:complete len:95 (-) Transcript_20488:111-395(-)